MLVVIIIRYINQFVKSRFCRPFVSIGLRPLFVSNVAFVSYSSAKPNLLQRRHSLLLPSLLVSSRVLRIAKATRRLGSG